MWGYLKTSSTTIESVSHPVARNTCFTAGLYFRRGLCPKLEGWGVINVCAVGFF